MQVIRTIDQVRKWRQRVLLAEQTVALVPTMGYLHEGHLALMDQAKQQADQVVVSIFVNPLQFGPQEDFERYPRDEERDRRMLETAGVHVLFTPSVDEMYPQGVSAQRTTVQVGQLTEGLCGARRPGHFTGVTTVVAKLFHVVQPDLAYFGQKDYQQLVVIRRMVSDLNMPVAIRSVATHRETDGLAMSSRNSYLNSRERKAAVRLYQALQKFKRQVEAGERDASKLQEQITRFIEDEPLARVDYVEIIQAESLQPMKHLQGEVVLALAVYIGKTRLIDNIVMNIR